MEKRYKWDNGIARFLLLRNTHLWLFTDRKAIYVGYRQHQGNRKAFCGIDNSTTHGESSVEQFLFYLLYQAS